MGRFPQDPGTKGSLKWIQRLVNQKADFFNSKIKKALALETSEKIEWTSPLKTDQYAEYRDGDFLRKLEITLTKRPLKTFWPERGPQWDALGRTSNGKSLLVEAKANIPEIVTFSAARAQKSIDLINKSLNMTKTGLGIRSEFDWSKGFYQYTNRLAHLYLLRELNDVDTYLVLVYFLNDKTHISTSKEEWLGAIKLMHSLIGIGNHELSAYVHDVFVDVGKWA
jgi:hypothetical protein